MTVSMDGKLVETATKITTTRNEYGDTVYGSGTSVACLYRDISQLTRAANREEVALDGLLWFGADEDVSRGDIYQHPDEGYLRIERVIKAKRLVTSNERMFIKCEVTKQRQIS